MADEKNVLSTHITPPPVSNSDPVPATTDTSEMGPMMGDTTSLMGDSINR